MKKTLCFLLAAVLLFSLSGCKKQEKLSQEESLQKNILPDVQNNNVFTDDFFADIVEIGDSSCGRVSGKQMQPVISYLKSLTLSKTSNFFLETEDEEGNALYGLGAIVFYRNDGTELSFVRNHAALSGLNANGEKVSYVIKEGNLSSGLQEAFATALNSSN